MTLRREFARYVRIGYNSAMNLLAEAVTYVVPVQTFDGITLILAVFFFYCLAKPEMVKNRTQFWGVFFALCAITLFYTLRLMLYNSPAGQVFCGIMIGLLQLGGLVLTVLYVGGLSSVELREQLGEAAANFRRGDEKPIMVPLKREQPKPRDDEEDEDRPPRIVIDLPRKTDEKIPLE